MSDNRFVVVKINGWEGEYICTAEGADCLSQTLISLGYTAEIEELSDEQGSSKDEAF
jgi:hypothetical protein